MIFYIVTVVVLVLDQLTKLAALQSLKPVGSVELIPGIFRFYYATNTGGAFSILSDSTGVLIAFTMVAIVMLLVWQYTLPRREPTAPDHTHSR